MVNKKILSNKWIKWYVVPICLFFFGCIAMLLYLSNSFLVLSYPHNQQSFQDVSYKILEKGDHVTGKFTAVEDNLGIVDVRFDIVSRVPYKAEDSIQFRIKEEGAKNWYYQNNYRSGLMYNNPLFPFGFPKIAQSKGKTYVFEITSLKGTKLNGISVSNREPVVFSTYQADKQALIQDKKALLIFGIKKFVNSLQIIDFVVLLIIFFLPFGLYLLLISPFWHTLSQKQKLFKKYSYWHVFLTITILLLIVTTSLFLQLTYNLIYIVLIVMWVSVTRSGGAGSGVSYLCGMLFLCFIPFILLAKNNTGAELIGAWGFLFLVAGAIQSLFEIRKSH